jgi:hypothetical protein
MLKRRQLGVDTWAPPIRVEVSTPSVDAQQLMDIARETARQGWSRLLCVFEVSTPSVDALFNRRLLSKASTPTSTLQRRHFDCIGRSRSVDALWSEPLTPSTVEAG